MEPNLSGVDERYARAVGELTALRSFSGAAKDFWAGLVVAFTKLAQAEVGVLLLGRPTAPPRWLKIGESETGGGKSKLRANFNAFLEQAAERALKDGGFVEADDEASGAYTIAIKLKLLKPEDEVVFVAQVLDFTEDAARDALARLALAADTPALFQANAGSRQAAADVEKFATVLDLMVPVNAESRFLAAQLALCNGVASRIGCDRVTAGWKERGYFRLKSMSRTEKFDRQMEAAQMLEATFEECADQDDEIIFPAPEGSSVVTRDHEKYARSQQGAHVASLPLRHQDKVIAVVTCERASRPFTSTELQQLRLLCDQLTPRLVSLHRSDRWFGARFTMWIRESAAKFLGPERTWAKITAILAVLLIAALFLVRIEYRVEGKFIVKSEAVSFITSPFDGYIERVSAKPGDALKKGDEIVSLDRTELLLQKAEALAQIERYEREAQKSQSVKNLAEMKINEALARQARAELETVEHRLNAAVLKAPFDGVIVEGDLRERISAPVKVGEAMYKVARIDGLYIEAEIEERDVTEVLKSGRAEFAFVSQPKLTYSASVASIEPAAIPKKEGNVFIMRLQPDAATEQWWRPGMTGLAKVQVEKRTLWWIFTHRTTDFLRMKLWW